LFVASTKTEESGVAKMPRGKPPTTKHLPLKTNEVSFGLNSEGQTTISMQTTYPMVRFTHFVPYVWK